MLIGQGGNDVRVTVAESDQIVAEMQRRNIPVTYVFYKDEGHGFRRPENRRSFTAVVEAFLAQHLGGRCEPVGEDFAGSSIEFRAGRGLIPSLG
jgi:dipeptidyl aminopeptidase/acylaminoacyl peptidase